MKKILALVVAFVLCFTAVAGCFTATAEDAVPTITIKDATAADGAIVIPVEGTNLQSVDSYLITIVLPADYTDIAVEGMTPAGENGGDYAVKGTSVKILNEIEKLDTDNDGAIAFNVTAKVPAVEADRVDDVTATVDAGNADAQPVDVTVVPGKATLKAPVVEPPVTEPVYEETLALKAASVVFKADLIINFQVLKSVVADYTDVKMECTLESGDVRVLEMEDYNSERNAFVFTGIAAKEVGDLMQLVIKGTKDGVEYYGPTREYGVGTYCYNQIRKADNLASFKTACVDLLNYASAAQVRLKYKTDSLANAGLTEAEAALGTTDVTVSDTMSVNGERNDVHDFRSASLTYLSKVEMNIRFLIADASKLDNYTIKATYTDSNGANTIDYTSADFNVYTSANQYYITFAELAAKDLRTAVTFTLYENGNPVGRTLVYSAEAYAARMAGTEDEAVGVALIKYSDSLKVYLSEK